MNGQKEIRFIDLFAGIGGFRLGLERANNFEEAQGERYKKPRADKPDSDGEPRPPRRSEPTFSCVWTNDWDKYACQTYNKNFKTNIKPTDITKVRAEDVPGHELLVGGFPCQSFSIAGKRKGFEDTRGTCFFEICRIVRHHRPRLLLLENVKGLLNHDSGNTYRTVLRSLDELGYDAEWEVLNSKNFGVPQNRERVFIVGHLRGKPFREVFPLGEDDRLSDGQREPDEGRAQAEYSTALRGGNIKADHTFVQEGGVKMIHNVYGGFGEGVREFKDVSPTIRTPKGGGHLPMVASTQRIRRLTPIECERLQGFPDGWTAGVSDTQRYKQMGNAVTVNVIEAIGRKMMGVEK